jgi:signal transduction histidine kinase
MGSLNLLKQHAELSKEELLDTVHIGLVCGEQLLTVINDVLDISKMEENRMELEKAPMDLKEVVEESVQIVSIAAEKKGLNIAIETKSNLPEVIGDKGRLRQVLVNLLSNAVKFSTKGDIKVTVETTHSSVEQENGSDMPFQIEFSVQDEGIGIPLEAQPNIFQPFCQADISTTRKYVSML